MTHETQVAKPVAAEDLRCGDVVTVLNEISELPSYLWCGDAQMLSPHEPVRVLWRGGGGGIPLKVKAICLPFVLVKSPAGCHGTLDVRESQLVRLRTDYASTAWQALRKQARRRRRRD